MRSHKLTRQRLAFIIILLAVFTTPALVPTSADADRVILKNGDVLSGKVVESTDQRLVLEHPQLGTIEIDPFAVESVEEGETVEPTLPAELAPEPEKTGAALIASRIKCRFETGATGKQGNTETFSTRAAFVSDYTSEAVRVRFDSAYFYGSVRNTINQNEYTIGLMNYLFVKDTPWFFFLGGRYDWKQFEQWQSRVSASTGVGCRFIKTDNLESTVRAGVGFKREYESEEDEIKPEGLLGWEMTWNIDQTQRLYADTVYLHDFASAGEYRVLSKANYALKLDRARGIDFSLGVENEYQSDVEPDFEHNDLKYYGALVVGF